ncbi:hypothetical protein KEM55_002366, partial [Ascosphaera atra]
VRDERDALSRYDIHRGTQCTQERAKGSAKAASWQAGSAIARDDDVLGYEALLETLACDGADWTCFV